MLKSLRSIVQEVESARDLPSSLQIIVARVRESMATEVCSVYIHDPDTDRYLFMATEGLNKSLEGHFSLGVDEGLIGQVARREEPLNLEDAASHPSFKFIDQSGEEQFRSFLGVPIIHHRAVLGVLVVQQRDRRRFTEDEEAFLVTMAAQLAGIIAHASVLRGKAGSDSSDLLAVPTIDYRGVAGSPGIGLGEVVVVSPAADLTSVPLRRCDDVDDEVERFKAAVVNVRDELTRISDELSERVGKEELALFDAYVMLLEDKAISGEICERIRGGIWAPGAVAEVMREHIRTFEAMEDPYIRDRAVDLRDLGNRLIQELGSRDQGERVYPERTILVGAEIPASLIAAIPESQLAGIVSVSGSGNSHVAILARAVGVPTVMGAVDLPYTKIDGAPMIVDGHAGRLLVNPPPDVLAQYREMVEVEKLERQAWNTDRDKPCTLKSGEQISLYVNTGLSSELMSSLGRGTKGVGLFRTEIPFLIRERFPTEEEQRVMYREHLEAFAPRPVTMRTLDVGGDKALPYFPIKEENPFLGWRGIRVTLDHPEIFLAQVRAMLKASSGLNNLRIMLPMICSVKEFDESKRLLLRAYAELIDEGWELEMPQVGVMIEVPAAVYQARELAMRADFLSVGSNDLTQYLLAVDRNNARVAGLYEAFHPAVLRALLQVVAAGEEADKPVSICGELAGNPGATLLLVGMGFTKLSMSSINMGKVRRVLSKFSLSDTQQLLAEVSQFDSADRVRARVNDALASVGLQSLAR